MFRINLKKPLKNYFFLVAGFSIFIILIAILLSLYTITSNYRSLSYLDKGYGINARIDRIYSVLRYGEKRQRNYLLLNKIDQEKLYNTTKEEIRAEYDELYTILKEEQEQRNNLITFKVLIDLKLNVLQKGETYLDSGNIKPDSIRKILAHGDFIMEITRETISKMKKK